MLRHFAYLNSDGMVLSLCSTTDQPETADKLANENGRIQEIAPADAVKILAAQRDPQVVVYVTDIDGAIDIRTEPDAARMWAQLRIERNHLLAETDWTQLPDSPLTEEVKSSYTSYRQALRDLPQTTQDPASPIWPEVPLQKASQTKQKKEQLIIG